MYRFLEYILIEILTFGLGGPDPDLGILKLRFSVEDVVDEMQIVTFWYTYA